MTVPGLRIAVDPFDSARRMGRTEMRDDVLSVLAQWVSVAENKTTEDMLWDIIEKVREL